MIAGKSQVRVAITNTNLPLLDHVRDLFGGSVRRCTIPVQSDRPFARRTRQTYQWAASGDTAVSFLDAVWSDLMGKQQEAQIAIDFRFAHLTFLQASAQLSKLKHQEW